MIVTNLPLKQNSYHISRRSNKQSFPVPRLWNPYTVFARYKFVTYLLTCNVYTKF